MKEFIEYLVKNLVDNPANVIVNCSENEKGLVIQLRVAQEDTGKVVGRKGQTIKALRTIALSVCARLGHRVQLELVE
jgi:predicted RNA-binding protein YlqC (UPF0109 family)